MSAPDKTLIVVIVTLLCLISALAAILAGQSHEPDSSRLSDWQKEQAVTIALNDTLAQGVLRDLESKFYWQNGMIFNTTNPQFYRVGGVAIEQCHEVAPGIDRIRYLPSVELLMGNESQGDINVYLFVDLDAGSVAYIGFTNRSGPDAGQYHYLPTSNGVAGYAYGNPAKGYTNVTIVDTGYARYQAFTESQQSSLFEIAGKNATVDRFLKDATGQGETYDQRCWLQSSEGELSGYRYIAAYPTVYLGTKKPDGSSGYDYLIVTIDSKREAVRSIEEGKITPPPLHPYPW